jgi:OFA family oxalate/formate antiporter-like MFS transporter
MLLRKTTDLIKKNKFASHHKRGISALVAGCVAIFWPGSFVFGFPGVMALHWQYTFHVDRAAIGKTLFFVLAAVGIFMFFIGRWQERFGPVPLTAFSGILCGLSTIMVGWSRGIGLVYLWAFLVGVSSAFIYLPALTVVQTWFPNRRGLVSGILNLVFALSAAVMSPIFGFMLSTLGYRFMTLILGLVALSTGLLAAPFMKFPPSRPSPIPARSGDEKIPKVSLTVYQALRTKSFWFLWLIWALAGAAGIAMVTLSTTFGISKGLQLKKAILILTAFNLTSGIGRLASGYISDLFSRNKTICLAFTFAGSAYLLFNHLQGLTAWVAMAAVVGFAFGTLFAVSAPLASDCFGMEHFAAIFGLMFTAYGFLAGALGPWLSGYLLDRYPDGFGLVFTYLGLFFFLSAVMILFVRPAPGLSQK